jgi:membrane-associated phospholipid phosphatase
MIAAALARPRGLLLVASSCFLALTLAVLLFGILPADAGIRDALLALAWPPLVAFMRIVNAMGDWRGLVPGTLLLFVVFPQARARWWIWLALMIAAPLAESAVKFLVGRSRPGELSMGFPSGHATAAAAFFGAVMFLAGSLPQPVRTWVRLVAATFIVFVGMARVILRAHWPSDALGGITLGLTLAAAAALLASKLSSPKTAQGAPPFGDHEARQKCPDPRRRGVPD